MNTNAYRLVDDGYATFKKIKIGVREIGQVRRGAGSYIGIIGKTVWVAKSEDEAFKEVVARYSGFANYAAASSRGIVCTVAQSTTPGTERVPQDTPLPQRMVRKEPELQVSASFKPVARNTNKEKDE